MKKSLGLLMICAYAVHAMGGELTLQQVRDKIRAANAHWVASETSVSLLTSAEQKRRMGMKLTHSDVIFDNFHPLMKRGSHAALPASFDWRNVDGVDYSSPILNQEHCGSCVAFATIGALETQMNITRKTPASPWELSPQYLFSCGGGGCTSGWTPDAAADFLKNTGVPDQACMPYTAGATGQDAACSDSCSDAKARSEKIVDYTTPTVFFGSPDQVKQALMKGPLVTTMMVYNDFLFYQSGVYKHVTGDLAGGHAVTIVGWNDADHAWIVRNSWGPEWGENGYFRVDYDDTSGVGGSTWLLQVSPGNGYVAIDGVRDYSVLSGQTDLNIQSTFAGSQAVDYTLSQNNKPIAFGGSTRGRAELDTTKYADGVYTLTASAQHDGQTATSEPRTVFILNGPFHGNIGVEGVTEGQTVSAETDITLDVKASPVPFTEIAFHAKNLDTGVDYVRSTGVSAGKMILGWRAQLTPNGHYELTMVGYAGSKVVSTSAPIHVVVQHS